MRRTFSSGGSSRSARGSRMTRTGSHSPKNFAGLAVVSALLLATAAHAAAEFYSTVDRKEVGTEDTFAFTIVLSDQPADAQLVFSPGNDFEVLSRQQANQFSYNMGPGGGGVKRVIKYILVLRANR